LSCQKPTDYGPEISTLKNQIILLRKTTDSLSLALNNSNNQISSSNAKITELINKVAVLNFQILTLNAELGKLNSNYTDLTSKISDLESQIEALKKLIYDISTKPSTLETGLVLYYPFNGNANDLSGYKRNGIVSGAKLTSDRYGIQNSAYNFNGIAGTKIQSTYSGILGNESRSISLWSKRSLMRIIFLRGVFQQQIMYKSWALVIRYLCLVQMEAGL
jgi:cell division protein FtsL